MITNKEIKEIFIEKSINHLYHVNTVLTSLTFLNNDGLLSRGAVDDMELIQTKQESDESDKEFGVFYDIFFDSVDIHTRAKKINDYGPITFVYSISLIDELPEGIIKITKSNPIYWTKDMAEEERYFTTADDLRNDFNKGTFCQHITLKDCHYPISFSHLEYIVIDDPQIHNKIYYETAVNTINDVLKKNNIAVDLKTRVCPEECQCKTQYNKYKEGYSYHRFKVK